MTRASSLPSRTKIVCTIGPASASQMILREMLAQGMDVARINFSHGDWESNLSLLETVRAAAEEAGRFVAILQDLQGPKIRVGRLPEEGLHLFEDHLATLKAGVESAGPGEIPVPYDRLASDVSTGDRILIEDGTKELEVVDVKGQTIRAKVLSGGLLVSHKGINVPTALLSVEALTEKDEEDLAFGLKQGIDFIALSFVRRAADITKLRQKIEQLAPQGIDPPGIIAKIEKHEALEAFDEILAAADGIMIARGDLGLETPASTLPLRQKELIAKCVVANKPAIVATHMLDSMQTSPRPTRAETSDVANAVIDHADALMLSGETATGQYPVKAVATMAEVARETEESPLDDLMPDHTNVGESVPTAVASAGVIMARNIGAKAILVTTHSGYSARAVARFRPELPIFAATDYALTRQQLLLSWGVSPIDVDGYHDPQAMVKQALQQLKERGQLSPGDTLVVISGLKREEGGYDSAVRVVEV